MRLIVCLVVQWGLLAHGAETLISAADLFDKEGKEKKFSFERFRSVEGDKVMDRAVYKDAAGDVVVIETMEKVKGQLVRYDIDQRQLKQKAWIEVNSSEKSVTYNLKKPRKRNYPQSDKWKPNFLVGLELVQKMLDNWDQLLKGEEIEVRLGVWHRQETIRFDLEADKKEGDQLVVKMTPSSMFIRAAVDPLYFIFDKKTRRLVSYKGRTTPKIKVGRSYKDFDGLVRYKNVGAEKSGGKKTKKTPPKTS